MLRGAAGRTGEALTRHPADGARLVASLAGFAVVVAATVASPAAAAGVSQDLVDLVGWLPATLREGALGVAQLAAALVPLGIVAGLVATMRARLLGLALVGAVLAAGAAAALQGWLDDHVAAALLDRLGADSWLAGAAFPSPAYLAGLAAAVTVLAPGLGPAGRRAAWATLALFAVVRVATAVVVPLHVASTALLGVAVGSAVLVALGGPARQRRADDVVAAVEAAGLHLGSIEPAEGQRWEGRLADGTAVVVRLVDRDGRDADLLYRAFSRLQRRGLGGERPAWSPRRLAEHEALVTSLARGAGVRGPALLGLGSVEDHQAAVVLGDDGRPVGPADLTDVFLAGLWAQVAALRTARLAHRRLHLGSVRVLAGEPVVADLADGEVSASDDLLAADVAELLVALGREVGPERAVDSAAGLGVDALAAALGYLQPLALSPETRRALRADGRAARDELLEGLRTRVQAAAGVEAVELAPLQRISLARIVGLFGAAVLVYVLLTFVSNGSAIAESLGEADLARLPVLVALTAVVFVAGAVSLSGAVTVDLPLSQTSEVMLAQSFLNCFTPANAGGMALRARYLQRHGLELVVAATSVGLTSAASGVAQVLFLVVFLAWSGSGGGVGFQLPDASALAVVVVLVAVAGAVVWLTPLRAKLVDSRLVTSIGRSAGELRSLAARPGKLARLLGGAALAKAVVLLAFVQAARALGIELGFAELGALYLTANTVASAAPTPGGVGALEAALVAALTGAGVDGASALSVVLVFRLATYWLPVPPAWLALRHLRASEAV